MGIGCYSYDFVKEFEEITIKDLLNAGLRSFSISYDDLREFLIDEIKLDIKNYIDRILCVDSIVRNDDRHFDNISFLYKDGVYKPAPIRIRRQIDSEYDGFINSIQFDTQESIRALEVIKRGLAEMEGISWERS